MIISRKTRSYAHLAWINNIVGESYRYAQDLRFIGGEIFDALTEAPDVADETPATSDDAYAQPLTDEPARIYAGRIALLLAVLGQRHFRLDPAPSGMGIDDVLFTELSIAEANYLTFLAELRDAARASDREAAADTFRTVLTWSQTTLMDLCERIGRLSDPLRGTGHLGLRVSELTRNAAMLAAGSLEVCRRCTTGPAAAGLRRLAENRDVLRRSQPNFWIARTDLPTDIEIGESVALVGLVESTGWSERPVKPYSFARLTNGLEVRVHHKDLKQNGITPRSHVWVNGKVEQFDDRIGLVAHFEGPGTWASNMWEDWIANEIRIGFDRWPRVIEATAEFAHPLDQYGAHDGLSRIKAEVQYA